MGGGRGRGPGWSLGLALRALMLAAVVTPALPGSLEALGGAGGQVAQAAAPDGSESLLRLRGGSPAGGGPAATALASFAALGAGAGNAERDAMAGFDIDTLQPARLPPLRPRVRRRHCHRAASGERQAKKDGVNKNSAVQPAGARNPAAVAAAAAAAAAAQLDAWEDAVSHVSASSGLASHVTAAESYLRTNTLPPCEVAPANKPFATMGAVRDFSGLLESQVGETSMDEEQASDATMLPVDAKRNKAINVGDTLNGRFSLVGLLGAGAFGKVFLAEDKRNGGHVAIKVQAAGNRQAQVAEDEIALLKVVANARARQAKEADGELPAGGDCVVALRGSFALNGAAGKQVCLALEPLGPSLLDVIMDHSYGGCRLSVVAHVMRDVLAGLDFLHTQCKIVHTDIKPENVLLCIPPVGGGSAMEWWGANREGADEHKGGAAATQQERLRRGWSLGWRASKHFRAKVVDLGNACPESRPFTDDIQTIEYRSPEVVLGAAFNSKADIWSAACMAFELITGEYLFDPQEAHDPESGAILYEREEDLLALQQELLGPIPLPLATRGKKFGQLMTESGLLRRIPALKFWKLEDVLVDKYCVKRGEAREMSDFLLPMLRYDPGQRASAAEMLSHPWLLKHLELP